MNAMAEARGGGFMAHTSALALATAVYNIWIERNNGSFNIKWCWRKLKLI